MNFSILIPGLIHIAILYSLFFVGGVLGDVTSDEWRKGALDKHNEYRKKHGAPPLTQSQELCDFSQEYADQIKDIKGLPHSNRPNIGENLFKFGHDIKPEEPVSGWYNEVKDYDFAKGEAKTGKDFGNIGHFTQVVWKSTKEVCTSFAKGSDGSTVVVSNYRPPGNFQGQFVQNVEAPTGAGNVNVQNEPQAGAGAKGMQNFLDTFNTCIFVSMARFVIHGLG